MKEKLRKISKYTSRLLVISFFLPFVTLCSVSEDKRNLSSDAVLQSDSVLNEEIHSDSSMFLSVKNTSEKKSGSILSLLFPKDAATGIDIALFNIPKNFHLTTDDLLGMLFPISFLLSLILAVISFLKKQHDQLNFYLILPVFLFYGYVTSLVVRDDVLYGFWAAVSLIFITFVLNSIVYLYKKGEEV